MATLEPRADKAVRDAVDAFMDGRFVPEFVGETVFETKNSRYRLVDGVVFSAPDASLFGAELVGWLCESSRRCLVESLWQPGSRAVLVDRRHERNIIVTSTTRLLHAEEPGSSSYQGGSTKSHADFRSWHPPPPVTMGNPEGVPQTPPEQRATPLPSFSPRHAPIVASTPPPRGVLPTPVPPAPVASATPIPPAPPAPRRGVHPPPRPIASPSRPNAAGPTPIPAPRPLPRPTPPPRRESPRPAMVSPPTSPLRMPAPPSVPTEWELTSSEIEIAPDSDTAEPMTVQQHNASRNDEAGPAGEGAEPVNSVPFPLVRPV